MVDFTGGITELYDLKADDCPKDLMTIMMKAYQRHSMMGCSIEPDPHVTEARMDCGLVRGHAYSITKAIKAQIETPRASGRIPLLRIRNPWGNETEWNGAWSDRSAEWQFIPDEEKENIGLTFEADGEYLLFTNLKKGHFFKEFSKSCIACGGLESCRSNEVVSKVSFALLMLSYENCTKSTY